MNYFVSQSSSEVTFFSAHSVCTARAYKSNLLYINILEWRTSHFLKRNALLAVAALLSSTSTSARNFSVTLFESGSTKRMKIESFTVSPLSIVLSENKVNSPATTSFLIDSYLIGY